jgi:hypothetical protein
MPQQIVSDNFVDSSIRGANTKTLIQGSRSAFVPLLAVNGGYSLLNGKQQDIASVAAPASVVAVDDKIWVAATGSTAAKVYNKDTNAVLASPTMQKATHYQSTIIPDGLPTSAAVVWLAFDSGDSKWYYDGIRRNDPTYSTSAGGKKASGGGTAGFTGIEYGNGYIWMVDSGGSLVWRIDIGGGAGDLDIAIGTDADKLGATTFDGLFVWIADLTSTGANTQRVWAINTLTSTVYQVKYPVGAADDQTTKLCFMGDSIWQACNGKLQIFRYVDVDGTIPGTPTGHTIDLTNLGSYSVLQFCFAGKYAYATTTGADVLKFDVETLQLVETIAGLNSPTYSCFDGTSVWISNAGSDVLTKALV